MRTPLVSPRPEKPWGLDYLQTLYGTLCAIGLLAWVVSIIRSPEFWTNRRSLFPVPCRPSYHHGRHSPDRTLLEESKMKTFTVHQTTGGYGVFEHAPHVPAALIDVLLTKPGAEAIAQQWRDRSALIFEALRQRSYTT